MKSLLATKYPSSSSSIGSWGSGPGGRSEDRERSLVDVELRLVARAQHPAGLLLVQRDRAADVGADLRVGVVVAELEALLAVPDPDHRRRTGAGTA